MKRGIGSSLFRNRRHTTNFLGDNHRVDGFDHYLLFEEKDTSNQKETVDFDSVLQSKFDQFFDEAAGESGLYEDFDGFDEVVFVDDDTD